MGRVETGGTSGAIYLVDVADGPALVLKLYPEEPWWRMGKETYVAARLQAVVPDVPAPRFLHVDDSRATVPHRLSVMTRLPGESLAAHDGAMGTEQARGVWMEAGALLRRIHDIPMEAFGYILDSTRMAGRADTNRAYMDGRWREKLAEFRTRGGDEGVASGMERRWNARLDLLDGGPGPRLCHGDYHRGNLMVVRDGEGWRLYGVLDFENAVAGDPLLDVTNCKRQWQDDGVRWPAILRGYGPITRPDWQETVELYRLFQAVEYWNWTTFLGRPEAERASVLTDIRRLVAAP